MAAKAGELFICTCCGGDFPEDMARMDIQLGPVCVKCDSRLIEATRWLAKAGITRPLNKDDITEENRKRFDL